MVLFMGHRQTMPTLIRLYRTCADPENSISWWGRGGGGLLKTFKIIILVLVINIFYRVLYGPLSKSNWTQRGPNASRGGSVHVPVFVWKHIGTCDFPAVSGPCPPSSVSVHAECGIW